MSTLYLVRHGETNLNNTDGQSAERARGWKNVPLNTEGRKEAQRLAGVLKDKGIKKLYCSDLERARDTATAIGRAAGVRPVKLRSLRPWDLGNWSGEPVKEILADMKEHQAKPDEPVPGGETWNTFLMRYLGMLKTLLREADKRGVVCAVAHYRNLKTTEAWMDAGMRGKKLEMTTLNKNDLNPGDAIVLTGSGDKWSYKKMKI